MDGSGWSGRSHADYSLLAAASPENNPVAGYTLDFAGHASDVHFRRFFMAAIRDLSGELALDDR